MEELLFKFKKNKKEVPSMFKSSIIGKMVKANAYHTAYMGCEKLPACFTQIEDEIFKFVQRLDEVQKKKKSAYIKDQTANENYFNYASDKRDVKFKN